MKMGTALMRQESPSFMAGSSQGMYSMMKYKGSEMSKLGTFEKKVPADVVSKVQTKEKAILDGSFKVEVNDNAPKSSK